MTDRAPGRRLQAGDVLELAIDKPVYRGRGLGRVDGRVVFVPRAFPGDRVRARLSSVHAAWAEASLVEVLEPSPARRSSPCPQGPSCGGCSYQDVEYPEQLRLKEQVLRDTLTRSGVPHEGEIAVHGSPEQRWRLRASLHAALVGGRLLLGYRQEGSHKVQDLRACQQLSPAVNEVAAALRERLGRQASLVRGVRGLDLLEAPDGSRLVASLSSSLKPREAQALAPLAAGLPGVTGFGIECEPRRLQWLYGEAHVTAPVLGLRLRAHVRSFFQSNRFLYESLAREVTALVPQGSGRILDLYAGAGLFSLPLAARDGGPVVAVEHAGFSSEDARANARANGIALRVVESDVAEALASLPPEPGERVVLDPPRTGAGPDVVDAIASRRPLAVVYVSCDPATLGRDLARFATHGYRARSLLMFDMFPDTFHLETVAQLTAE